MTSTSRKSSFAASAGKAILVQVAPPSLVRSTVPPDPVANAIFSLAALTPRSVEVTPLVCGVQVVDAATRSASAGLLNTLAGLHHERDFAQRLDVDRGIAVDGNQIREPVRRH